MVSQSLNTIKRERERESEINGRGRSRRGCTAITMPSQTITLLPNELISDFEV
jgi:hypothetical protein